MAESASSKGVAGKGKRLTDKERIEILDLLESDLSLTKVELGRRYGISGSAITKLAHNAEAIRSRHADGSVALRDNRQRGTKAIAQPFEEKLYRWLYALEAQRITVPPAQVIDKAMALSTIPGFVASNGWYYRFINRYGFKTASSAKAEATSMDATINALQSLRVKLASFGPEYVYAMDVMDLFYRWLPHYDVLCPMYAASGESFDEPGAKDRTSVFVCSNALGSHKLPPLVVDTGGLSMPTRYSDRKNFPLPYATSGKAWCVDAGVFRYWFEQLFVPEVRKLTTRPVLLLLESSRGQFTELTRENVTTMLLPPNTPAMFLPMAHDGLLASLKLRYKFRLLAEILSFRDKPVNEQTEGLDRARKKAAAGLDAGRPPHLLEAMDLLKYAWEDISVARIQEAWRRTTLLPEARAPIPNDDSQRDIELVDEMVAVFPGNIPDLRGDLQNWLDADAPGSDVLKDVIYEDLDRLLRRPEPIAAPMDARTRALGPWPGVSPILAALAALESLYEHPECKEYLGESVVSEHLQQIDMQRRVLQRTKSMKDRKRRREESLPHPLTEPPADQR
ncbi:hypothetical protein ACHHYP_15148 [Achlya hypogyna]|uniref:HTH CENPB-type domain-containing protein n=1 Tax=Achlya hypogyna TaxID=1202772 RepID=A0A1V9YBI6_ACHHY|nr:hypothetical protein ACHHYP_15148 [Achlya hypogyna]